MGKCNILIVDGSPENISNFTTMLEGLDINIISASSGNEALILLLQYDFALVLLDDQIPDMNGFEFAELIGSRNNTRTVPIILITAISKDQNTVFKGYESGAVDFIFKPIEQPLIVFHKVKVFCELYEARKKVHDTAKFLSQNKTHWQLTFDTMEDLMTIHDTEFHMLHVNQATASFFDKEPEELEGRRCFEIFCENSRECNNCPIISLKQDLRPHKAEISHPKLKKTFLVSVSPIFDDEDNLVGIIHIAKDISEKKNLENQLRQARKMQAIGTLASGIAHDFNNILTPIICQAELLRMQTESNDFMKDRLDIILQSAGRATQLVKQILSCCRQQNQEKVAISIQAIIKEALNLLRASLPTTIEIRQKIDMSCGAILADPTQIHQLIMNLCTNSSHAMAEHNGVLEITLNRKDLMDKDCYSYPSLSPGPYLNLEISDTGCGIKPELLDRIFEPYFTTKENGKGTGMGLSVVHGIVTSHKGQINVYSEVEKGTTFSILLPMAESNIDTIEQTNSEELLPTGTEHVLLVDDEYMIVEVNGEILNSLGYRVTSETNSKKALELFRSRKDDFDLVITDMTMPGMTGIELAKELLEIRPEISVILCTGFSEVINAEQAYDLGIREYLYKPVTIQDMATVVHRVLKNGHE